MYGRREYRLVRCGGQKKKGRGRKRVAVASFFAFLLCGILTQPLSLDMHAHAGEKQSVPEEDIAGRLEKQAKQMESNTSEMETILIYSASDIAVIQGDEDGQQPEMAVDGDIEGETLPKESLQDEDSMSEPTMQIQEKDVADTCEPQADAQEQKIMYLTFDDGPSKEDTEAILDILKERNVKATFFLIGENVERYPEVAKRIAAEGHTIGIHCYSHEYKKSMPVLRVTWRILRRRDRWFMKPREWRPTCSVFPAEA